MIRLRAASMRWMTRWPLLGVVAGQVTKADAIELRVYGQVEASCAGSQVRA